MPFTFHWSSGSKSLKKIASFLCANFHKTVYHTIAKIQRHKSGCRGQAYSSYMDIYLTTLNPNADKHVSLKWGIVAHLNDGKGIPLELAVLLNVSKTRPWDFTSAGNIDFFKFPYSILYTYNLSTLHINSFYSHNKVSHVFIEYIIIH